MEETSCLGCLFALLGSAFEMMAGALSPKATDVPWYLRILVVLAMVGVIAGLLIALYAYCVSTFFRSWYGFDNRVIIAVVIILAIGGVIYWFRRGAGE
jgi:NhaP-type Na+/H+ or K+/H+ antiporter